MKWVNELFVERAPETIKWIMKQREAHAKEDVAGLLKIFKGFKVSKNARILDAACGLGRISVLLAKKGFQVTGNDISRTFLRKAKAKAKKNKVKAKFIELNSLELSKKFSAEFDALLSIWTSFGYYDDAINKSMLHEFNKALKKNGLLVMDAVNRDSFVNSAGKKNHWIEENNKYFQLQEHELNLLDSRSNMLARIYEKKGKNLKLVAELGFNVRAYSLHELNALLKETGFKLVKAYGNLKTLEEFKPSSHRIVIVARKK